MLFFTKQQVVVSTKGTKLDHDNRVQDKLLGIQRKKLKSLIITGVYYSSKGIFNKEHTTEIWYRHETKENKAKNDIVNAVGAPKLKGY